jgi:hypothetical protein
VHGWRLGLRSAPERVLGSDLDLQPSDLQALSHPGALAALFDRLGYRAGRRTPVSPGHLGITAERLLRTLVSIELLAEGEDGFQVYLFDLQRATDAHLQALARAFRHQAGFFLLVLPGDRDYSTIDFVFLEEVASRQPPAALSLDAPPLPRKRKPWVFTLDRHHPTPVQVRFLRRFTWTERDGSLQADKILGAYAMAEGAGNSAVNRAGDAGPSAD